MQADKAKVGVFNGTYTANLDQRTGLYFHSLGLNVAGTGKADQNYNQTTVYMCPKTIYVALFDCSQGVITGGNQISFNQNQCKTYAGIDVIVVLGSDWIPKLPTGF